MRKIFGMCIILVMAFSARGQQDQKAKEILDKVSEKTRSLSTISADFVFSMVNDEMEINESNEGTIKFKGEKYCVDIPDAGFKIFSDGKSVWNYMKEGNQVTITNLEDAGGELMDPTALFSIYEKGFRSDFIKETTSNGKQVYEIELFPETEEFEVSKISLAIDKTAYLLQSATLYSTDGNKYSISVRNMELNRDFVDSEFVFNASTYGDIEIIDLR